MAKTHIKNVKRWTKEEDDIIINNYPRNGSNHVEILLDYSRTNLAIRQRARKLGLNYLTYNENYFEKIDSYKKAYWIGYLCADGYVTTQNRWGIELCQKDVCILEELRTDIQSNCEIRSRSRKSPFDDRKTIDSCQIQFSNSKMYNDLLKNGVVRNKTNSIKLPEFTKYNFFWDFVRGLYDGDGNYYIRGYNKEISLYSNSEYFLRELIDVYSKYNITTTLTKSRNVFVLKIADKKSILKFIENVFLNEKFSLQRKKDKALEIYNYCRTRQ